MKKNMPGMDFEVYSERLATLHEYCFESKPKKNWAKKISDNKWFGANEICLKRPNLLG